MNPETPPATGESPRPEQKIVAGRSGRPFSGIGRALVALLVASFFAMGVLPAGAYQNEVYASGGSFRWKINNVEQGTTADLSTAIYNCIWQSTGAGREIHVLTGGDLTGTVYLPGGVQLFGHGNTFNIIHTGIAVYAKNVSDIAVHDMTVNNTQNYVFRITACNNVNLSGINVSGGWIGMRVDSRDSNPWLATSYNLTITDCLFENLSSHGIETYGIDGVYVDGIVARNNGECGVLFNNSRNGYVGSVDAYRCSYGSGYAGLRFANDNANFRVKYLKAVECGRGFFTTTGAINIVVEEAYIRDCSGNNVLIQYGDGVGINSGSYNGGAINHYTSKNCWINATDVTGVTRTPPAAPAGLTATVGSDRVSLSWPAISGATSYRLQRSDSSDGPFFTVAYTEVTSYVDRDITGNSTYYYRVRAVNTAGPGDPSVVATAVVSGPATPLVDLNTGLLVRFPFDGSTANTQGGSTLTVSGGTTYTQGIAGQALDFNGSTTFGSVSSLSGASYRDFTAATWIMRGTNSGWRRIFDFGNGTSNYMMLALSGDTLVFDIAQNGQSQSVQAEAPDVDRWAHVAVTFGGNRATLYVNGEARKSIFCSNNPVHLTLSQNYLGKSQWPDPLYQGRMDDFRLYNRSLHAQEVSGLVMGERPMTPFGLKAGGQGVKADLNWSGVVNATSYNIKRATVSGGPYTTIATGIAGTSYSDTQVVVGSVYYYVVTGSNSHGESDPSNESSATISDLIVHLKFDESSGNVASDSSGNNWNATLVNGPTFGQGKINNALQLPSTAAQHATLPAGVVAGLNNFTVALWLKVSEFSTWARVFDFGTSTSNYMFLTPQYTGTPPNAAKLHFAITTSGTGSEQTITSSTAISPDAWVHVAITRSGNTGRMYLNGNLVGSNSGMTLSPSSLGVTSNNLLGWSQWTNDPYLQGALDDFRIYSRALSASEVTVLANPPAEPPDLLVAKPDDGKAVLTWSVGNSATSYNVKRSTTSGGPYTVVATGITATNYTDTGLANGSTYYYVVSSSNSQGESANSSESSVVPTYLRIHLKLDEVSGAIATDSSGRGLDGTLVNSPTFEAGEIDNALKFTASSAQYADLPSGIIDGLTSITLMAWVKPTTVNTFARVFDFGNGITPGPTAGGYMCLMPSNGINVLFSISTSGYLNEQNIGGNVPLAAGVWSHVAVTLSGNTGRLYVNGSLVGSNGSMTLNPASLGSVVSAYLGKSNFASDPYLNGSIDDFRVYSRVMTASEITRFANPLAAPQGLTATGLPNSIQLNWNATAGATSYTVKVAANLAGPFETLADGLASPEYLHDGIGYGTTRHYFVCASNLAYTSDPSQIVTATSETPLITDAELIATFQQDEGSGGALTILQSVVGHYYQLQTSPDLTSGSWISIGSAYPGNGGQVAVPVSYDPEAPHAFFRIRVTR